MAERLTIKNSDNTYSQPTDTTFEMVFNKLGELEDILEKYNIDSVEELEELLDDNKYAQNVVVKQLVELQNAKTDRDAWKRACELACEREDDCYVYDNIHRAYEFYQQAKTEGIDE